ncbi:hypothetical protein X771_11485 [Mesorhizobium sp. LSJC277A00]|nr:hypothetical protein X771_11485 [Mesorhizobium sp. LSJC277A00]
MATPVLSRTSPNGTPGILCKEKAKSGAISPAQIGDDPGCSDAGFFAG